jgi:hypothetical protein
LAVTSSWPAKGNLFWAAWIVLPAHEPGYLPDLQEEAVKTVLK